MVGSQSVEGMKEEELAEECMSGYTDGAAAKVKTDAQKYYKHKSPHTCDVYIAIVLQAPRILR
jgi:hypothetical protein